MWVRRITRGSIDICVLTMYSTSIFPMPTQKVENTFTSHECCTVLVLQQHYESYNIYLVSDSLALRITNDVVTSVNGVSRTSPATAENKTDLTIPFDISGNIKVRIYPSTCAIFCQRPSLFLIIIISEGNRYAKNIPKRDNLCNCWLYSPPTPSPTPPSCLSQPLWKRGLFLKY